ncbi:MAG: pantoate--beta-alanine ligase [Flavobacteriales bacterium]|nr:pantoate--beta-alanine ligase [Flavobacteriales bacterium]
MEILRSISSLQTFLQKCRKHNGRIGFVPTMGALHAGHLSLLSKSIQDNDYTICSIYVNPKQFNNKEDLVSYPRTIQSDIEQLNRIHCDALFLPSDSEMYQSDDKSIEYNFTNLFNILEGEKRPGHFLGVITIVHKLFNLINPDKAYFGEKDYQQLRIIQLFVKKHNLPVEIVSCPTVRNSKGLALSSRNKNLKIDEEKAALNLVKALRNFKNDVIKFNKIHSKDLLEGGDLVRLKHLAIKNLVAHPLIKLDYFEIIASENFRFTNYIDYNENYRALIAVYIGEIRLIDNIAIN